MAIIYSYPEKTTPAGGDFLVITDSEQPAPKKNRTKSLTIDNLASYISTSIGGITGGGTLNTIAMFTPDGKAIGDSIITQSSTASSITISGNATFTNGMQVANETQTNELLVFNQAEFNGDASFDTSVYINGPLYDQSGSTGSAGQLLTSTSQGIDWDDASDVVSGAVAKLIPYITTATPGGSETYTSLNNIVKIGWSGGNGIYVINLPSAATIPYRVIRFVTNGTYPGGGAHKVRFTATGGETIDGAAFFETSKVYEGIAAWSTGTEWVIIQAKAH